MTVSRACSAQGPPDRRERRRQAVVAAARELFLERGFDAVSLGEIVKLSGGSLSTLYELFENKAGLLRAVIKSERCGDMGRIFALAEADSAPAETLSAIAREVYDQFLDGSKVGLMRIAISEGLRDPSFAQGVYEEVHLPFIERIEALFSRWHAEGRAMIPNAYMAAKFFVGAVLYPTQTRALCGDLALVSPEQRDRAARAAAELFVRGYAIKD